MVRIYRPVILGLIVLFQNDTYRRRVTAFSGLNVIVVKIGGSSVTRKEHKETLDLNNLEWFSRAVSLGVSKQFLSPSQGEDQECQSNQEDGKGAPAMVIVHGAGSFGHHTAKEYGLRGRTEEPPASKIEDTSSAFQQQTALTMHGVAKTRLSVQTLNREIVSSLIDHGVNAIGISPCFAFRDMQAHGGGESDMIAVILNSLNAGLVPVLHGDACLYGCNDAGILSGDVLMEMIGKQSWISSAVFITDVPGVFTSDPRRDPDATLLRHVPVDSKTANINMKDLELSGSSHGHDVTGGLKTKLASAAAIAASGVNVTIVKCGTKSAEQALYQQKEIEEGTVVYSEP